uniref:tryptophan synthase n=1 Tax=Eutreptiella gymnastica TaxID=73025 RepID=A0A7S4LBW4_9EUGL
MSVRNLQQMFQTHGFSRLVYVTAGYPEPTLTVDILLAIQASGRVEAVEIGVPFTDPTGDGPIIAECSKIAMEKGTTDIHQVIDMLKQARAKGFTLPCLLMGYANTFKPGWMADAKGFVDGVIVVDLPLEEPFTHTFVQECKDNDISFVPILTPLTSAERVQKIGQMMASSFCYCTTVLGVTGARDFLRNYFETEYLEVYNRFKSQTGMPCIVGFGVSSPETVQMIRELLKADGVVVGSAFMKCLQEATSETVGKDVVAFLQGLFV